MPAKRRQAKKIVPFRGLDAIGKQKLKPKSRLLKTKGSTWLKKPPTHRAGRASGNMKK